MQTIINIILLFMLVFFLYVLRQAMLYDKTLIGQEEAKMNHFDTIGEKYPRCPYCGYFDREYLPPMSSRSTDEDYCDHCNESYIIEIQVVYNYSTRKG